MSEQTKQSPADIVRHYRRIEEIIPRHWSEDKVIANGIHQHYYRTGGGKPPVILLHGIMEGALSWIRTAWALEHDYDVIMPDTRGHGLSDGIATGYTPPILTEDVAGLMRTLGLGETRVLGFSQGASTGIYLADRYPELVQSLILAGMPDNTGASSTGNPADSPGYQAWFKAHLNWLEQLKSQTHEDRMLSGLSRQMSGAPLPPEDEYVAWIENCARLDLDLFRFGMTLWASLPEQVRDMTQALQRVTCPTLIMKSSFFPQPGAAKSLEEEVSDRPNVRIVRFVNTGHLIMNEQFEPFIRLTKEFFAAHTN